jgi:SAM-dependent methyltransferase
VTDPVATVREALPRGRALPDVLVVGDLALAERLLAELPGLALLATDASPAAVDAARARGVPAQVQALPHLLAPDAAYDVVVAPSELTDTERREVVRVLRPGGRLLSGPWEA